MTRQQKLKKLVRSWQHWAYQAPRNAAHAEQCRVSLAAREQELSEYVVHNLDRIRIASGR